MLCWWNHRRSWSQPGRFTWSVMLFLFSDNFQYCWQECLKLCFFFDWMVSLERAFVTIITAALVRKECVTGAESLCVFLSQLWPGPWWLPVWESQSYIVVKDCRPNSGRRRRKRRLGSNRKSLPSPLTRVCSGPACGRGQNTVSFGASASPHSETVRQSLMALPV